MFQVILYDKAHLGLKLSVWIMLVSLFTSALINSFFTVEVNVIFLLQISSQSFIPTPSRTLPLLFVAVQ